MKWPLPRRVLSSFSRPCLPVEERFCGSSSYRESDPQFTLCGAVARAEIAENKKAAHAWFSGLMLVAHRIGIKTVYYLSATRFFLSGSGYGEGTLFPWVVSDFALVEAIEAGIVKVPRVPVADDAGSGDFAAI
jgi:type III restriction enzyme